MKSRVLLPLACVLALAALGAVAAASGSTAASGGKIAFRGFFDPEHEHWGAVFTVNPDGTGVKQLTHPTSGTLDDQPAWSADGKRIVFTHCPSGELCHGYWMKADGTGVTPIGKTCPAGAIETTCADESWASFSPNGKLIALVASTGVVKTDPSGEGWIQNSALTLMNLNGTGRRVIFQKKGNSGDVVYPTFSPNGKQLVFEQTKSGFTSDPNARAVFVINLDGSGLKQLTPWKERSGDNPDWSPDGKWILFQTHVDDPLEQGQYVVVHPDGTGRKQITNFPPNTDVLSASFSPDSKSIVISKGPVGGNVDIWTIGVDGTGLKRVTTSPRFESAPDWGKG